MSIWAIANATKLHRYTSTACQHGHHLRCRQVCKFCEALCRCKCHRLRRKLAKMEMEVEPQEEAL